MSIPALDSIDLLSLIMAFFALLGALDRIFGNRLGLGAKFEEGISIVAPCALSMIGMLVLAPWLAGGLRSVTSGITAFDISVIPAMLFANDMGGAPLAIELSGGSDMGCFNAFVVASMMGCTVSFTLPTILELVGEKQQNSVFRGILCGIVGIPFGCVAAGIYLRLPLASLLLDLIPIVILAGVICAAIVFAPDSCIRVSRVFGIIIRIVVTVGLIVGIITHLTGIVLLPGADTYSSAGAVVINAAAVAAGAFPLIYIIEKLLKKPLASLGRLTGLNGASTTGFLATLASSVTTFSMVKDMDDDGIVLNSAFVVPASFVFSDHLAFTLAMDGSYASAVIIGKLCGGAAAVAFAVVLILLKKRSSPSDTPNTSETDASGNRAK